MPEPPEIPPSLRDVPIRDPRVTVDVFPGHGLARQPPGHRPIIIATITVATTANKTVRLIRATSLASQPPADYSYLSISGNPEKG